MFFGRGRVGSGSRSGVPRGIQGHNATVHRLPAAAARLRLGGTPPPPPSQDLAKVCGGGRATTHPVMHHTKKLNLVPSRTRARGGDPDGNFRRVSFSERTGAAMT